MVRSAASKHGTISPFEPCLCFLSAGVGRIKGPSVSDKDITEKQFDKAARKANNLQFRYSCAPFVVSNPDKELMQVPPEDFTTLPIFVWRVVTGLSKKEKQQPYVVTIGHNKAVVPWVVWDKAGKNEAGVDVGVGVYQWRAFCVADIIGVYTGYCLRTNAYKQATGALPDSVDALITIKREVSGGTAQHFVIDGKQPPITAPSYKNHRLHDPVKFQWPGMGAHYLNAKKEADANVQVTDPFGFMQVVRGLAQTYDPLSFCLPEAERCKANAGAQLFWWYGKSYGAPAKQR